MRWAEFIPELPAEARAALLAAVATGCAHACQARACTGEADEEIDVTAAHLDAALERLAQARELLALTARVVRERRAYAEGTEGEVGT